MYNHIQAVLLVIKAVRLYSYVSQRVTA